MNTATAPTAPPRTVLWGLARLLQGAKTDTVPLENWTEPWQSVGRLIGNTESRRPDVLRTRLHQLCGDEAEQIARSILAIDTEEAPPQQEPWDLPIPFDSYSLPPFPTGMLPEWLRCFVEAEAEATQTPPTCPQ